MPSRRNTSVFPGVFLRSVCLPVGSTHTSEHRQATTDMIAISKGENYGDEDGYAG